jgi:hypothetical protein
VSNPCFMCNSHQAEIAQLRRYIAHLEGLLRRAEEHVAREYRHGNNILDSPCWSGMI